MYKFLNIDKELKTYGLKKKEEIKGDKILEADLNANEIKETLEKNLKKIVLSDMVMQEKIESLKNEIDKLYKDNRKDLKEEEREEERNKIELLKMEKEALKREIGYKDLKESKFLKKIISIIDEFYRLRNFAKGSGNSKLIESLDKNLKYIKKELKDINIVIESSLGEKFNEEFHECLEVREDKSKENMTIVEELSPLIIYEGKVLRAASVVVIDNKGEK